MSGPHTEQPAIGDPAHWIARAIAETLAYGGHDRATARELLDLWKHRDRLSSSDRAAVLAWFGDNLDDDEPAERPLLGPPMQAPGLAMR